MRRVFQKTEEQARPVRFTNEPEEEHEEQVEEERYEPAQVTRVVRSRPPRPRSGRALRWLILIFGSLGIFSAVVPLVSGVSVSELLQGANLKLAYSGTSITVMRGMAALKAGNLAAATDAVLALPPMSAEAADLAATLSPKLLNAGDYSRAAQICRHLDGSPLVQGFGPSFLGKHLAERQGLASAYSFVTQNPDAKLLRAKILPGVFAAAATRELPALEKLALTLKGEEKESAATTIFQTHRAANRFEPALRWSARLPARERSWLRYNLLSAQMGDHVEDVIKVIGSLEPGADANRLRNELALTLARKDSEVARKYAEQLAPGHQRDLILGRLSLSQAANLEEKIALTQRLSSVTEKFNTLVGLVFNNAKEPFVADQVMFYLTPLAKKDPTLAKTHDDLIRYLCVTNPSIAFADNTLDPKARDALKKEILAGGPHAATFRWSGKSYTTRR